MSMTSFDHSLAHAGGAQSPDGGGVAPGLRKHLPHAFGDEGPVRLRVEHLRAGHARNLGVRPLALGHRHLPAVDPEQDGAAAAGASVEREEQLSAHALTTARLTTARRDSPAANRLTSSATMVTPRSRVS